MQPISDVQISVTDAVALINNTLDTVYPLLTIVGEISDFKISKNKWVYFDIKDDYSKLRCFGNVYMLPGPLEDGMLVQVVVSPRLHPQYGFTANISSITPVGEGSLKKAADLLFKKLEAEGLFAEERKRPIPTIPDRIALVASTDSAGYSDFIKVVKARWPLLEIDVYHTSVQGVDAPSEITNALTSVNESALAYGVVVLTRGGGSADDLAAFADERVVRAVAGSRFPTVVAIGHERDLSLAELAADLRASTPSNAAEIITPSSVEQSASLASTNSRLGNLLKGVLQANKSQLNAGTDMLRHGLARLIDNGRADLQSRQAYLAAVNPQMVLKRGYALVRSEGRIIKSAKEAQVATLLSVSFADGDVDVTVNNHKKGVKEA